MKEQARKIRCTIDLQTEVMEVLKRKAEVDGSSVAVQVRRAIKLYVDSRKQQDSESNNETSSGSGDGLLRRVERLEKQVNRLTNILDGNTDNSSFPTQT